VLFGIAANLWSTLDVTEQAGEGWTLAEPTVSCKSGREVPIAAATGPGLVQHMRYAIDVAFIDRQARVRRVCPAVGAGRVRFALGAVRAGTVLRDGSPVRARPPGCNLPTWPPRSVNPARGESPHARRRRSGKRRGPR